MAKVVLPNVARNTLVNADLFHAENRKVLAMIQAGWRVKAHSNGTTKVAAGDITTFSAAAPSWGSLQAVGSGTGPSVTTKTNSGLMTITGVSGLVSPTDASPGSEGNFLTFTGFASAGNNGTFQIAEVLGATSCKVWNNNGVAGDANNGLVGVTWAERTIRTAPYVYTDWSAKAPWVVLEGPRLIKVPINASALLFASEVVTQGAGSTQRQGELLGIVFGATSGWAIIDPHDFGTWDTSTITGTLSGVTIPSATITATPVVYVTEVMIAKSASDYTDGSVFYTCNDPVGESTKSLSYLATQSDCLAGVAPGVGATGGNNALPGFNGSGPFTAFVARGTADATSPVQAQAHAAFYAPTTNASLGTYFQVMCANAIPRPGRSADYSWTVVVHSDAAGTSNISSFQRLDEAEPGDPFPFASYWQTFEASSEAYTHLKASVSGTGVTYSSLAGGTSFPWRSFLARGCGVAARDIPIPLSLEGTLDPITGNDALSANATNYPFNANHPDASPPTKRYSPRMSYNGAQTLSGPGTAIPKASKGRLRWFAVTIPGNLLSTYDTKRWFACLAQGGVSNPAILVGPYDGTTTPLG